MGAEQLAQRGDLDLEIIFLDNEAGPNEFEQLILADHAFTARDQRQQQIKGAGADTDGLAIDKYPAFGGPDLNLTEPIVVWQVCSRDQVSSHRRRNGLSDSQILAVSERLRAA